MACQVVSLLLYNWPAWPPGLSTRTLPLHRMSVRALFRLNECIWEGLGARVDSKHTPFQSECVRGELEQMQSVVLFLY